MSVCSFNCGENWHDPVKCKVSDQQLLQHDFYHIDPSMIKVIHKTHQTPPCQHETSAEMGDSQ